MKFIIWHLYLSYPTNKRHPQNFTFSSTEANTEGGGYIASGVDTKKKKSKTLLLFIADSKRWLIVVILRSGSNYVTAKQEARLYLVMLVQPCKQVSQRISGVPEARTDPQCRNDTRFTAPQDRPRKPTHCLGQVDTTSFQYTKYQSSVLVLKPHPSTGECIQIGLIHPLSDTLGFFFFGVLSHGLEAFMSGRVSAVLFSPRRCRTCNIPETELAKCRSCYLHPSREEGVRD